METEINSETTRLPHETREVFLARMLLRVVEYLDAEGASGALDTVLNALEEDSKKNDRQGRSRPGRHK